MISRIFSFPGLIICFLFISCNQQNKDLAEIAKQEIAKAEKDFETMVDEKGLAEGFTFFADSNAIIKRGNDSLIKGKDNIRNYYAAPYFKTASVTWSPDFIEASSDGTLGYTFGKYIWQTTDSSGKTNESRGVFHTVWKKQNDGSWKYVWD